MYRPNSYFYGPHLSPMSSYATDQALLNSFAEQKLSDEELIAHLAPGATMLGALGAWLAETICRGLVALGEVFAPPVDLADADAVYYLHPPM